MFQRHRDGERYLATPRPGDGLSYQQLFDANPQPMWVYDLETLAFLAVNPAATARYGYSREEFLAMTLRDIRPPEDVLQLMDAVAASRANPASGSAGRWRHLARDGTLLQVEILSAPMSFNGRAAELVIAVDVSARIAVEAARDAAEQILLHAVTEAPVPLMIYAQDGTVLAISRTWTEMTGYTAEELPTLDAWTRAAYGDHQAEVLEGISGLFGLTKRKDEGEFTIRCKDGSARVWHFSSIGLPPLADGTRTAISIAADMTERRAAENSLRHSMKLLELAHESAQIGTWEYDPGARAVTLHPNCAVLYGFPRQAVELPLDRWKTTHVHPEDWGIVSDPDTQSPSRQYAMLREFRAVWPDGSVHWIEERSYPLAETGRDADKILGIDRDITQRVEREDRMLRYVGRLERSARATVRTISKMLELRDPYTAGHEVRVARIAAAIGRELGLSEFDCEGLRLTGELHDVGKITCPTEILSKPGRLTSLEFDMIKAHAEQGYQILKDLEFDWPVADIVRQHHERLDGTGYPRGLKGDQIRLEARIIAVADVVEAIASHRPYRPALPLAVALEELRSNREVKYDADVVDATLALFESGRLGLLE